MLRLVVIPLSFFMWPEKGLMVVCVSLCFHGRCELAEHTAEIRVGSKEINILGPVSR